MLNRMLEQLTGYHRYPPMHPEFFEMWWHPRMFRRELRDRWKATCREVGKSNRVEELHAVRENYLRILQAYSLILKGTVLLLPEANGHYPEPERLRKCLDEVQALLDELASRWVTLDDLYSIVAEHLAPSPERAAALAAAYPPPQSWYDEDFDPFTPEE